MNTNQIMQMVGQLQQRYGANANPEAIIMQMMSRGQISQAAYDNAVRQAQQFQRMFSPSAHRR